MNVSEIMTAAPAAATPDSTVRDVARSMYELDVRHIPIVHDGELQAIVSDRDLRTATLPDLEEATSPGRQAEILDTPVIELAPSQLFTVSPTDDVLDVIEVMVEQRVGAVPVVETDEGRLVGIVSYVDVLRAAAHLL